MALRIGGLKKAASVALTLPTQAPAPTQWPSPPVREPLPIVEPYATKAQALLKPWHPLFEFDLGVADGDITFAIRLRNLLSRDLWTHDAFKRPVHHGMFPIEAFAADPATGAARFEQYVFRCLVQFVSGLLSYHPETGLHLPLVRAGVVDWAAVVRWLNWLAAALAPWFDLDLDLNDAALSLVVAQPTAEMGGQTVPGWLFHDVGQQIRPWHAVQPTELVSLPVAAINQECLEIAAASGDAKAIELLRKLILEQITNNLYFLKFAI